MANHLNVQVIAHRGAAGEAPENTLAAFRLAVEQQCDGIELDVQLSREGELIVCHDSTINRTTNGKGKISDMTVEELKSFDAGSWFGEAFAGERLPLLSEVFDLVPHHIFINVETKTTDPGADRPLVELLKKYDRLESTVVSSFNHKCLKRVKELEPAVKVGLLYTGDFVSHRGLAEVAGMPVYSLHPNNKLIGREDIADAVQHNLVVYPYTINDDQQMLQRVQDGASGIITDYPGKLRQLLNQL